MPARKTKTYPAVSGPTAPTDAVVPNNPARIGLFIQNTGVNPGVARFGGSCQNNGSDMLFAAGGREKWDQAETCPQESVSLSSALATTWCIVETISQ